MNQMKSKWLSKAVSLLLAVVMTIGNIALVTADETEPVAVENVTVGGILTTGKETGQANGLASRYDAASADKKPVAFGNSAEGARGSVGIDKWISDFETDTGIATVNLKVQGSVLTPPAEPVAVLLIIDRSGSMKDPVGGKVKMDSAITAAETLVNTVLGTGGHPNSVMAMISYSGDVTTTYAKWYGSNQKSTLIGNSSSGIKGLKANGGTNSQLALKAAGDFLAENTSLFTTAPGATRPVILPENRIVIFLTDGLPTFCYTPTSLISVKPTDSLTLVNGTSYLNDFQTGGYDYDKQIGNGSKTTANLNASVVYEAKRLYDSVNGAVQIHSIGFDVADATAMFTAMHAQVGGTYSSATSTESLNELFKKIDESTSASGYEGVVTDPIGADFTFKEFIASGGASYDEATKTITWDVGTISLLPQTISYKVQLKPEAVTPTSIAGAFLTNGNTVLEYKGFSSATVEKKVWDSIYNDQKKIDAAKIDLVQVFPQPKVYASYIDVTKTAVGITSEQTFQISVGQLGNKNFTVNEGNNFKATQRYLLLSLFDNKVFATGQGVNNSSFDIKENTSNLNTALWQDPVYSFAKFENDVLRESGGKVTVSGLAAGRFATVEVLNQTATPLTGSLTIVKEVNHTNGAPTARPAFTFELLNAKGQSFMYNNAKVQMTIAADETEVTRVFTDLAALAYAANKSYTNFNFQVKEVDGGAENWTYFAAAQNITLVSNSSTEVYFTNTYSKPVEIFVQKHIGSSTINDENYAKYKDVVLEGTYTAEQGEFDLSDKYVPMVINEGGKYYVYKEAIDSLVGEIAGVDIYIDVYYEEYDAPGISVTKNIVLTDNKIPTADQSFKFELFDVDENLVADATISFTAAEIANATFNKTAAFEIKDLEQFDALTQAGAILKLVETVSSPADGAWTSNATAGVDYVQLGIDRETKLPTVTYLLKADNKPYGEIVNTFTKNPANEVAVKLTKSMLVDKEAYENFVELAAVAGGNYTFEFTFEAYDAQGEATVTWISGKTLTIGLADLIAKLEAADIKNKESVTVEIGSLDVSIPKELYTPNGGTITFKETDYNYIYSKTADDVTVTIDKYGVPVDASVDNNGVVLAGMTNEISTSTTGKRIKITKNVVDSEGKPVNVLAETIIPITIAPPTGAYFKGFSGEVPRSITIPAGASSGSVYVSVELYTQAYMDAIVEGFDKVTVSVTENINDLDQRLWSVATDSGSDSITFTPDTDNGLELTLTNVYLTPTRPFVSITKDAIGGYGEFKFDVDYAGTGNSAGRYGEIVMSAYAASQIGVGILDTRDDDFVNFTGTITIKEQQNNTAEWEYCGSEYVITLLNGVITGTQIKTAEGYESYGSNVPNFTNKKRPTIEMSKLSDTANKDIKAGDDITYTLVVNSKNTYENLVGVKITDTMFDGLTTDDIRVTSRMRIGFITFNAEAPTFTLENGVLDFGNSKLSFNETWTIKYTLPAEPEFEDGEDTATWTNKAVVTANGENTGLPTSDGDEDDEEIKVVVEVRRPEPSINVTKNVSGPVSDLVYRVGDVVTYTVNVRMPQPNDAKYLTDIVLTDAFMLDDEDSIQYAVNRADGDDIAATSIAGVATYDGVEGKISFGKEENSLKLFPGDVLTVTYNFKLKSTTDELGEPLVNTVVVDAVSERNEPVVDKGDANVSAEKEIPEIFEALDATITLVKTATPSTIVGSGTSTYEIVVTNKSLVADLYSVIINDDFFGTRVNTVTLIVGDDTYRVDVSDGSLVLDETYISDGILVPGAFVTIRYAVAYTYVENGNNTYVNNADVLARTERQEEVTDSGRATVVVNPIPPVEIIPQDPGNPPDGGSRGEIGYNFNQPTEQIPLAPIVVPDPVEEPEIIVDEPEAPPLGAIVVPEEELEMEEEMPLGKPNPKTGDAVNAAAGVAMLALLAGGLAALVFVKKKMKEDQE